MTSSTRSPRISLDFLKNNLEQVYREHPAIWVKHVLGGLDPQRTGSLDPWQEQVMESKKEYELLNCSRQSGKSSSAAAIGLHTAIFYPKSLILLVSPSLRQSSELFRKVKEHMDVMANPPKLIEDNKLSCTLSTGSRILSLPGEEKTIRGFSAPRLIIEDEASRVPDALNAAIRPMLTISHGRLIEMSTPFGKRGHFFEAWENGGDIWGRTEIPWWECPRITPEFIESERKAMSDFFVNQEYCCKFVQTQDQVFSYDLVLASMSDEIEPLFPSTGETQWTH